MNFFLSYINIFCNTKFQERFPTGIARRIKYVISIGHTKFSKIILLRTLKSIILTELYNTKFDFVLQNSGVLV
jgi:hypothetical protein